MAAAHHSCGAFVCSTSRPAETRRRFFSRLFGTREYHPQLLAAHADFESDEPRPNALATCLARALLNGCCWVSLKAGDTRYFLGLFHTRMYALFLNFWLNAPLGNFMGVWSVVRVVRIEIQPIDFHG